MSGETVGDQRDNIRVWTELWISFVSLVRSYVAAHDLGRIEGRAFVDDGGDGRLTVREEKKILTIEFDAQTGAGQWTIYEDEVGPERLIKSGGFRISPDSMVRFSDRHGAVEMEIAAEAFTAKVFEGD